jgi:hypothetical protein
MDDHLSPEGNLAAVLNMEPEKLRAGAGTDDLSRLFEEGIAKCRPTTREQRRQEMAEALRVLRAVARQAARGVPNGAVRLSIPDTRILDDLLARPNTWGAEVSGRRPPGEAEGGAAEDPRDSRGRVKVRLKPAFGEGSTSLLGFFLAWAAVTLAETIASGQSQRIGICQAPVEPFDLTSRKTCGRFFVGQTGGRRKERCSENCRKRVSRRQAKATGYPPRKAKP